MTTDEVPTRYEIQCEVYSRIVGYIRPLGSWNPGKLAEFAERVPYKAELGKDLAQNEPPANH